MLSNSAILIVAVNVKILTVKGFPCLRNFKVGVFTPAYLNSAKAAAYFLLQLHSSPFQLLSLWSANTSKVTLHCCKKLNSTKAALNWS